MFHRINKAALIVLFLALLSNFSNQIVFARPSVVRAVLFFSETCDHCHIVIDEVLPPLAEKYQQQLDIVGIDVQNDLGQNLYQAAASQFQVPDDRIGIPTLIIGNTVLVGSREIPEKLPGLIEQGLASGGIDWPNIPGLAQVLASQPDAPQTSDRQPQMSPASSSEQIPTFVYTFLRDPVGNSVSVGVLIIMLFSIIVIGYIFITGNESKLIRWPYWVVPALAAVGLIVALYLSFVEVTKTEAVCGPVGDCNSVQESPYAMLFGVLPVGIMGVAGYIAIMAAWVLQTFGSLAWRKLMAIAIWSMAWFGILFSIYLTFLEPFVIGATCMWCITSAIVMTLLLWVSTGPALDALKISHQADEIDIDAEDDKYIEINENRKLV